MEDEFLEDEDFQEFYEDDLDDLTPEDIFKMVLVNKKNNTKVKVELIDKDGDQVDLVDMISELIEYVKDKLDEDSNQFVDQILPLMSQSVVSGLSRMIGIRPTAFILANDLTSQSIVHMMCVGFLLLKLIQQKGLTIVTHEEEVDPEEIEEIERKSRAGSAATLAGLSGQDPKQVLTQLFNRGDITRKDLESFLGNVTLEGEEEDDGTEVN